MRQKLGPCHCGDSDQEVTTNIKYALLRGSLEGAPKALQSHAVRCTGDTSVNSGRSVRQWSPEITSPNKPQLCVYLSSLYRVCTMMKSPNDTVLKTCSHG